MALPFVTDSQVKKAIEENKSRGSSSTDKNYHIHLEYTLDELLEYLNVPVEEIPEEVIWNIEGIVDSFTGILTRWCSYVEFYTKDDYAFKGTLAAFSPNNSASDTFCGLYCVYKSESHWSTCVINYKIEMDADTGDSRIVFMGISDFLIVEEQY